MFLDIPQNNEFGRIELFSMSMPNSLAHLPKGFSCGPVYEIVNNHCSFAYIAINARSASLAYPIELVSKTSILAAVGETQ
jgi:hypothetical protein